MRLPSGIPGFDALIQGGIPSGSAVVVQGPAGLEKDAFLLQFVVEGLQRGGCALVVLASTSPSRYQGALWDAGVDVAAAVAENRLKFVDWFTYKENPVQGVEQDGPVFRASIDLANVGVAISRAVSGLPRDKERRAAVEVLSPALAVHELENVYGFVQSTKTKLQRSGFTSLFVLEKDMHDERTINEVRRPFDGLVDIERTRDGDRLVRNLAVLSMTGSQAASKYVPLEIGDDRSLRVGVEPSRQISFLHLAEAIKSNPRDPNLWLAAARNLLAMGDFEQALRCAEGALALDAGLLAAWGVKADALSALGRHGDAEKARARGESRPAPPAKQLDYAARILAFAEQRLRKNPDDPDALFVTAAARAKAKDVTGAIAILDKLAEIDETYPGLWVLKTMFHAKLGQIEKAQESRARRLEVEARLDREGHMPGRGIGPEPEPSLFCDSCRAAVLAEESVCPQCGAPIARPQLPLPAAPGPEPMPRAGSSWVLRPVPSVPGRPERSVSGFTNGAGPARALDTGRTNGLASRPRTNGLTNGLVNGVRARASGLVNGIRGRTNGVTTGLVNGFRMGRRGLADGLTNGSGFTNGLGGARFRREARVRRSTIYVIPILAAMLLVLPLVVPNRPSAGIRIDGEFADWQGVSIFGMAPTVGGSANVDITGVALQPETDAFSLLVQVRGQMLAGEPSPGTRTDSVFVFVDLDRDARTGYAVRGLGADRLLVVRGRDGVVSAGTAYRASASEDPRDWRTWSDPAWIAAAASGDRLEVGVGWLLFEGTRGTAVFIVMTMAWDRSTDVADLHLGTSGPPVRVEQRPIAPTVLSGSDVPLLALEIAAPKDPVSIAGLTVNLLGTAPLSSVASVTLVNGQGMPLAQRIPVSREVKFTFPVVTVDRGATDTWTVTASVVGSSGETLGARVLTANKVDAGGAILTLTTLSTRDPLGYLGGFPAATAVDGGYAEWASAGADDAGEASTRGNPSVDLDRFAVALGPGSFTFYARLHGPALAGTVLPTQSTDPSSSPPLPDRDRDTVPDDVDPFRDDFDNDGVRDVEEGGDHDGDGLVDHTYGGSDRFLNTTIPATFPFPYAGRPVSVYIGPTTEPPALGEDALRVYADTDNATATGFFVAGIGADILIEVRGREGVVANASVMDHTGSPWAWSWTHRANLTLAVGLVELEGVADVSANGSFYVETSTWGGAGDVLGPTTRGDGGSPRTATRGDARPPQALDISGNQKYWLRDTNHGTETACGTNKVASTTQGSGPLKTVTLSAGQDACWYADSTTGTTISAGSWETLLDTSASGLSAATASFNTGTGTSTIDVVINFQAEAMILWLSGRTGTTDSVGGGDHKRGMGFGTSTTDRRAICSNSKDFDGNAETDSGHRDDAILCSQDRDTGVIDGLLDISAIDADSVTFVPDDAFPADYRVHGLFLGGAVLTNAATGMFNEPTATGDQNIVVPGSFQPEAVFLMSAMINGDPPGVQVDSSTMLGFAAGAGNPTDVIWSGGSDSGPSSSETMTYARTGESIALYVDNIPSTPSSASVDARAEVDAWNSDGFSLNWIERASTRRIHYLALDGLAAVVGDLTTSAILDTDIVESGFGFSPAGAVFVSAASVKDAADTPANREDEWSLGAFTSATSRVAQGTRDNDGEQNMVVGTILEHDAVYAHTTTSDAIEGLVDLQSVDTGGFTLNQDDADPFPNYVGYLAFGTQIPYDVYLQIWNKTSNSVRATIGSCLSVTTNGDDVQCLVSGVSSQTIASDEVVRIRVRHSGSTSTLTINYDTADASDSWSVSRDGSQEGIYALAVYNSKLYAAQGSSTNDGDIFAYDGNSWTTSYNGAQEQFWSLAVYNGNLYAGQGNSAGDADVYVFDDISWTLSYDGAQERMYSLAAYNGKLYAGQGVNSGDGDVYVFDGNNWNLSYDGAYDSIYSLAVYNSKLYAGTVGGAGGDVLVYDGTSWATSYDGAQSQILALAVYNNKLYAGQGAGAGVGDVLAFDGTSWTTSYDGAQEQILSLSAYNGKLYAGQGDGTGDGDIFVFDGVSWTTSYDGAQEQILCFAVYIGKLYAGQGNAPAGDGDILVFEDITTGDSRATIPVPEFADIVAPVVATLLVPVLWRRTRHRTRRRRSAAP